MKSADEIKRLQADGWELVRVKGAHHQFRRPGQPGLVTARRPKANISLPTLRSIDR